EIEARRLAITRAQALRDEIATETIRRDARRFWLLPVEELGSPVAAAQRYLIVLGYLTGIVDGIAGPATNAAAQRFRRDNDLDTEIRIDTILIAALVEAAAAPVSKPSQTENTY
ncbi:MAG: hypothetical protein HN577_17285, partial [Rhodospirillaceae bacterium]|nr:hypothetical protein [Rhodospirillaceae bacterium]